jgi:RNA:NAD 2'-phosphotransferase (TPT1/KptA family)
MKWYHGTSKENWKAIQEEGIYTAQVEFKKNKNGRHHEES